MNVSEGAFLFTRLPACTTGVSVNKTILSSCFPFPSYHSLNQCKSITGEAAKTILHKDIERMSKDEARTVTQEEHDVIIVGGGPVGLFLGLTLAQKGIDVLILEAEADIVPSPRALM